MCSLISYFWQCGDNQIIEFALQRARLNRHELEVVRAILDDCMTQEETAEVFGYSVRRVQFFWKNGTQKLLSIPWVVAYAKAIKEQSQV